MFVKKSAMALLNVEECVGLMKSKIYNIIESRCSSNIGIDDTTTIRSAKSGKIEKIVKKLKLAA